MALDFESAQAHATRVRRSRKEWLTARRDAIRTRFAHAPAPWGSEAETGCLERSCSAAYGSSLKILFPGPRGQLQAIEVDARLVQVVAALSMLSIGSPFVND